MNRSSNSRVWNWARTRMATRSSGAPSRSSRSISSPTRRASSGRPTRRSRAPCRRRRLGPQRLAKPLAVARRSGPMRRRGCRAWSGSSVPAGSSSRRENPFRSAGYWPLRRRARNRSTGRRPPPRRCSGALRQQPQPQVLDLVGVLVFVDHDVFEALLVLFQHVAVGAQHVEHVQQQVAEIAGVQRFQPVLIELVELLALAVGVSFVLAGIEIGGVEAPCSSSGRSGPAGARASAFRQARSATISCLSTRS
jgi:hypothetical protein